MTLVARSPAAPRRMSLPNETFPSDTAPAVFHSLPMVDANGNVTNEPDFGKCCQCGAPQSLSEAAECYLCGSDNRLNVRL